MTCIRCGSSLIRDPLRHHWFHCPNCSPEQATAASRISRLLHLDVLAASYAADKRGTPTIGGSRDK